MLLNPPGWLSYGLPDAVVFSFAALAHDLFPRLPDSVVDPGGTWVDTLRWHTDGQRAEVVSSSAYTYTLVGDTLVDGRGLVHIAVAGKVDLMVFTGRPGRLTRRHMTGSSTGIVLWDPERRLAAYHEYERDLEGTVSRPGREPFGLSLAGPVRIRLVR